jgi:hypothetical protein
VDFNRDGKLDVLVGDWSNTLTVRPNLSRTQRAELGRLIKKLAAIDAEVGYDYLLPRSFYAGYQENRLHAKRADQIEKEMTPYLVIRKVTEHYETAVTSHGYLWVYLRR